MMRELMDEFDFLGALARENQQYSKMLVFQQAEGYANTCHGMSNDDTITHVTTLLEGALLAMESSPKSFTKDEKDAIHECLGVVDVFRSV